MLKLKEFPCIATGSWLSKSISFLNTKLILFNEFLKYHVTMLMLRRMLGRVVSDKQIN